MARPFSTPRPDDLPGPDKGGRPPSLTADAATLKQIEALGRINCTRIEGAAFFGCTEKTFITFLQNNAEADEAFERGRGMLRVSLKRKQIEKALVGNITMLIWLGKQLLGQKDKIEQSGDPNAPVTHAVEWIITDPPKREDGPAPEDAG